MPNVRPISPELFLVLYTIATIQEIKEAAAFIVPVLPEIMLHELKTRGTNLAIQYGGLAVAIGSETQVLDARAPIKVVQYGLNELQHANSLEEATTRGLITLGALSLTAASTDDASVSFAWAAFLGVFATKILGYQVMFSNYGGQSYLIIYAIKKGLSLSYKGIKFIAKEGVIEIERRKYNLPRKRLKLEIRNRVARLNPFRRNKGTPKALIINVLRIKKRQFKV